MERESFIFKKSWLDYVTVVQPRVRLDVYEAIINYSLNGTVGSLGQAGMAAFMPIKNEIDADRAKEEKRRRISEARKAAGRKGGKATKDLLKQIQAKMDFARANDATGSPSATTDANANPQTSNPNPQTPSRAPGNSNQDYNIDDKNKKQKIDKEAYKKETEKELARRFIDYFNRKAEEAGSHIPHHASVTPRRIASINARRDEYGDEALRTMVDKAVVSRFLNGAGMRGFIASIDWLLRPNNFPKVLEGNYDNDRLNRINSNTNSYGNNGNYDPRRGVEAGYHSPEEYE